MSAASLRVPGPSFLRPRPVRLRARPGDPGRIISLGMSSPSTTDDGWWLGHLWAFEDDRIVDALEVTPLSGPPPEPPPAVLGPRFAGGLAGLVAEEGGRQLIRLKLYPAPDETRPWERPLVVQVAVRWDPVRAATMRPTELAGAVLEAFARSLEAAGRAG